MNVIGLFPKLLVTTKINFTKKQLDFVLNQKTFDTDINNGKISKDNYILNKKPLASLKKDILIELEKYFFDILKLKDVNINIVNSWSVINKPGQQSHTHNHLNSFCSGVLYLKKPKNSGDLIFHRNELTPTDNISPKLAMQFKEYNDFNCHHFTLPVNEGDLVLFPSLMNHSTQVNNSNEDRLILAFNVFLNGKFDGGKLQEIEI